MLIDIGGYQIRHWREGDESAIVKYANNWNVSRHLRDSFPFPYTTQHAKSWLEAMTGTAGETAFAIASPEEAIGGISYQIQPDVYRRSAEIGYWLGEPFWGRGIATCAVRALTDHIFSHHDIVRIYAGVFEGNPSSMRVLEKAGYTCEGRCKKAVVKNGIMLDQFLYAITR
jgi:ribosomal-protein-alanine N-acetyltransferase